MGRGCQGTRLRSALFQPPGLHNEARKPPEVADVPDRDRQRTHERGGADHDVLDPDRLACGLEIGQKVAGPERFSFSERQDGTRLNTSRAIRSHSTSAPGRRRAALRSSVTQTTEVKTEPGAT